MRKYFRRFICFLALTALAAISSAQTRQSSASPENKPAELVQRFYEWYLQELSQDRDPVTQDRAALRKYVSPALINEIERLMKSPDGLEADYFLQTQDYMDEWKGHISVVQTAGLGAEAEVVVTFGVKAATTHKLTVRLKKESSSWKITRVLAYRR